VVQKDFLSHNDIKVINLEIDQFDSQGLFKPAGIGRADRNHIQNDIRGDRTCWLDTETPTTAQKLFVKKMNEIKQKINEDLFLGLWDFEGHYAIYPKGSFYKKHLDTFRDSDLRTLSFILYLNDDWKPEDQGQLKIYAEKEVTVDPMGGTLVCFLSHKFEHEVLPTNKERRSFTGWFRKRTIC
jgi:SM-20-related protein